MSEGGSYSGQPTDLGLGQVAGATPYWRPPVPWPLDASSLILRPLGGCPRRFGGRLHVLATAFQPRSMPLLPEPSDATDLVTKGQDLALGWSHGSVMWQGGELGLSMWRAPLWVGERHLWLAGATALGPKWALLCGLGPWWVHAPNLVQILHSNQNLWTCGIQLV